MRAFPRIFVAPMVVALVSAAGCSSVTIESTRKQNDATTIEPIAIVVYQGPMEREQADKLAQALVHSAQRRRVVARATVFNGTELDENASLLSAAQGMRGLVTIRYAGGSHWPDGSYKQILYDARAFRVVAPTLDPVWRGRVQIDVPFLNPVPTDLTGSEGEVAETVILRLVDEHVVNGVPGELPYQPPASSADPAGG